MKILHLSALPLWSMNGKGGMPSFRETLMGHFREGHEIQLILPFYDLFSDKITKLTIRQEEGIKIHQPLCRWLPVVAKVRSWSRKFSSDNSLPYPVRWISNVCMFIFFTVSLLLEARRVRKNGFLPDIVYANNQFTALSGFILRCRWHIPNVTRLYGTFLADLMKKPFVSIRYPTAAAGFLIPSNLLICANDGTRGDEVARKLGIHKNRFRFWQNGIQPPPQPPKTVRNDLIHRSGPALRSDSKWIISCSRLSAWKRIDRMIHALSTCRKKGVDCQLLIAGDGEEREPLVKLAADLGLTENVIFLGAMAHDDIWALMTLADVFMITNDVTNRCNPLFEAAWAGVPVVSVFDPSTADLLHDRENSLLTDKNDTEALGLKLVELCNNSELTDKLSNEQKKLAKSFWTWEERMSAEVKEIEKIVSHKNKKSLSAKKRVKCR